MAESTSSYSAETNEIQIEQPKTMLDSTDGMILADKLQITDPIREPATDENVPIDIGDWIGKTVGEIISMSYDKTFYFKDGLMYIVANENE